MILKKRKEKRKLYSLNLKGFSHRKSTLNSHLDFEKLVHTSIHLTSGATQILDQKRLSLANLPLPLVPNSLETPSPPPQPVQDTPKIPQPDKGTPRHPNLAKAHTP